jgi:hypothetical protein
MNLDLGKKLHSVDQQISKKQRSSHYLLTFQSRAHPKYLNPLHSLGATNLNSRYIIANPTGEWDNDFHDKWPKVTEARPHSLALFGILLHLIDFLEIIAEKR